MSDKPSAPPSKWSTTNTAAMGAGGTAAGVVIDYVMACLNAGHLVKPGYAMVVLVVTGIAVPAHIVGRIFLRWLRSHDPGDADV